ncbi:MAG: universal stress protein [Chloroflexota bacterium]
MYRKILVPLDGSELAECVFPHVKAIAEGCKVPDVVLVRVVEPKLMFVGGEEYVITEKQWKQMEESAKATAQKYLDKVAGSFKLSGANLSTALLMGGTVATAVTDYAEKNGVDLIVIATHGRSGVSRWVWGSQADRILRAACVPVLMIRAPGCLSGF